MLFNSGYAAAGALTGLAIGLTGVGGGALMTPILLLFFQVNPGVAIATDLWFAVISKGLAVLVHGKAGQVDWQVVRRLLWGSLPIALSCMVLVNLGLGSIKLTWLTQSIGAMVILTAFGLLLAPDLLASARTQRLSNSKKFKLMQPGLTVLTGAILGLFVAFTSIGAGALGSVLILYLYPLRMTPHRLVATDIAHAIPLAIMAGAGYLIVGMVDYSMLANLLIGSLPAVLIGSFLSRWCSSRLLQVLLALVLLLTGIKVFV